MMRSVAIALVILLSPVIRVNAQGSPNGFLLTGEVVYEEVAKLDIQLEGVDAGLASQIPDVRKTEKVLYFTEEEALFKNLPEEDPGEHMSMEGSGMIVNVYEPDNQIYFDLKDGEVIEQKEFMSRSFLIESELEPVSWKLTGEQREILDYACQEAIREVNGGEVHVWFTPQIPVSIGPGRYHGLPGMVLAVVTNGGDRTLEAIRVVPELTDTGVLKKPTKGKKVTQEAYQAIVDEKLKEMGVEGDGTWNGEGGPEGTRAVVIRIEQQ